MSCDVPHVVCPMTSSQQVFELEVKGWRFSIRIYKCKLCNCHIGQHVLNVLLTHGTQCKDYQEDNGDLQSRYFLSCHFRRRRPWVINIRGEKSCEPQLLSNPIVIYSYVAYCLNLWGSPNSRYRSKISSDSTSDLYLNWDQFSTNNLLSNIGIFLVVTNRWIIIITENYN